MKNKKIRRKVSSHNKMTGENTLDKTLKSGFWGFLIALGIGAVLLFTGTSIAYLTDDPTSFVDPIGYVSLYISSFLGGFATSKLNKRSPYLTSALAGAGFILLSMLLSFSLPHSLSSGMKILLRLALHTASFISFLAGAFAGVKGSSKAKHQTKRRKRK